MEKILWFNEISRDNLYEVGEKAVNLAGLVKLGLPIPPGFVISSYTFNEFLHENKIRGKIVESFKNLDVDNSELLRNVSTKIQEMILKAEMPDYIKEKWKSIICLEPYKFLRCHLKIII